MKWVRVGSWKGARIKDGLKEFGDAFEDFCIAVDTSMTQPVRKYEADVGIVCLFYRCEVTERCNQVGPVMEPEHLRPDIASGAGDGEPPEVVSRNGNNNAIKFCPHFRPEMEEVGKKAEG